MLFLLSMVCSSCKICNLWNQLGLSDLVIREDLYSEDFPLLVLFEMVDMNMRIRLSMCISCVSHSNASLDIDQTVYLCGSYTF